MKHSWKDAPEWANYLAMDKDGTWNWYEVKPFIGKKIDMIGRQWVTGGNFCTVDSIKNKWKSTLEERPKKD